MANIKYYKSGICTIWINHGDSADFCSTISKEVQKSHYAHAFIYYSAQIFDPQTICLQLRNKAPKLSYCGCSTSGEVTPDGVQDAGAVAILLPSRWFSVQCSVIEHIDSVGMYAMAQHAADERQRFEKACHVDNTDQLFAINLIDGLTFSEDAVTSALHRGLGSLPLIGGSAGDNLAFKQTTQIHNGQVYSKSAVLTLVYCTLPFQLYTDNNFIPTDKKLVVTESDPDKRIVYEMNAEPAAVAYSQAIGVSIDNLTSQCFASHAVIVRVGGEYHCRSIQKINEDLSLSFFCAIDNGVVLTVSKTEGMVRSTKSAIERIEHQIGELDMLMGFECVYRIMDARYRNVVDRMDSVYKNHHFIGFCSYGEQYRSMHINQTFTGVAFGIPHKT